ncbi:MAG TPA: hypothetical protein VHF22_01005 [Planctomycetota bacterium]|nr:hypothetical protein [Planctomycetota bacterium]
MTEASERALHGLRDLHALQWYVIPMLSVVFYIYVREMKEARASGNWDAIFAGLTLFGMDVLNETANGWVLHLTQRSALWTAPGESALRLAVGWNIEIVFMFLVAGIVYYHSLAPAPGARIFGIPDRWFWAIAYSAICVAVELVLHASGIFVWEYRFWNASLEGVPLIFLFGYFHFYVAVIAVLALRSTRAKAIAVGGIYGLAVAANALAMGVWGWVY